MSDYLSQPVVSGHMDGYLSCPCRKSSCNYPDCPLGDPGTLHACATQQAYHPYPLDVDEFRAYLLGFAQNAVVGFSCDDGKCPLACFLNAQFPGSRFFVNMSTYLRDMSDISLGCEPDASFSLPVWAVSFAWLTDCLCEFSKTPITAFDALSLLLAACAPGFVFSQEVLS